MNPEKYKETKQRAMDLLLGELNNLKITGEKTKRGILYITKYWHIVISPRGMQFKRKSSSFYFGYESMKKIEMENGSNLSFKIKNQKYKLSFLIKNQ